jgi:membrane-associated phospholipid phosphatase
MMDGLLELGIAMIVFLQGLGDWMSAPMKFFSFLGDEEFYLLIMPIFYWSISTTIGIRLGLLLLMSSSLNTIFKLAFQSPRPFWYNPEVKALTIETSFGIPSGHSQNAVSVWGGLAASIGKSWAWILAILLIAMIGISRIYVGVHFPTDVLVGWGIGILFLIAFFKLEPPVKAWFKQRSLSTQIMATFGITIAFILIGFATRAALGAYSMPTLWMENALAASEGDPPHPLALSGIVGNMGAMFGLLAGALLLPALGGYQTKAPLWKHIVRFVIGVVGVFILWRGLGIVFPPGETTLAYFLRYFRYALVGLWISGIGPLLFIRLNLAKASEPKIVESAEVAPVS